MLPRFDFHIHTIHSDGLRTPVEMVEAAEAQGLEAAAITDHGPEISVGISPVKIFPMLQDVELARKDAEIPILVGLEANIVDYSGSIDIGEDVVDKLDIIVVGLHRLNIPTQGPKELTRRYLEVVMNVMRREQIDVLAHPFYLHGDLSSHLLIEDIDEFAKLAAEKDVAIELNTKYHVPDKRLLLACMKEGVRFSIGTDAHIPSEVGDIGWQVAMLRKIGAKREDLILDRFL